MSCTIRLAQREDLPAINEIYNHYVLASTCTYQETPEPMAGREAWFNHHGATHPVTVAEQSGVVVGWASLSPYHARSAYRFTVENSVYVDHRRQRQGIGSALLGDLIERARTAGLRTIVACIDADQGASIAIHAKHGFLLTGRLKQVGRKFDTWLDVVYMQLLLEQSR